MSAEGRLLRVDGLGVLLACWSPRTRRASIRTLAGCPLKACRVLLPNPIPKMFHSWQVAITITDLYVTRACLTGPVTVTMTSGPSNH
jgi:hypothetical protein